MKVLEICKEQLLSWSPEDVVKSSIDRMTYKTCLFIDPPKEFWGMYTRLTGDEMEDYDSFELAYLAALEKHGSTEAAKYEMRQLMNSAKMVYCD